MDKVYSVGVNTPTLGVALKKASMCAILYPPDYPPVQRNHVVNNCSEERFNF